MLLGLTIAMKHLIYLMALIKQGGVISQLLFNIYIDNLFLTVLHSPK